MTVYRFFCLGWCVSWCLAAIAAPLVAQWASVEGPDWLTALNRPKSTAEANGLLFMAVVMFWLLCAACIAAPFNRWYAGEDKR